MAEANGPTGDVVADRAWYSRWFGEDYLAIYPHRDSREAALAVAMVLDTVDAPPGARVLDLACGAGRHVHRMAALGLRAVGLDLSIALLRRAKGGGGRFVRGDMRVLPFGTASFDLVTNFFTSFGYFPERAQDARVVDEVARVLRTGGWFAFDFLNADLVRRTLRARDERHVHDRHVVQTRRLLEDGHVVEKRIEIRGGEGPPRVYTERVRLYDAEELAGILDAHDLSVTHRFGDYEGNALDAASPRVILVGRAS